MSANRDLEKIRNVASVLKGYNDKIVEYMEPEVLACFHYAPITSVDVERSFSALEHLLSDRRHNLSFDNLKKITGRNL